jgi:hypothetical protein
VSNTVTRELPLQASKAVNSSPKPVPKNRRSTPSGSCLPTNGFAEAVSAVVPPPRQLRRPSVIGRCSAVSIAATKKPPFAATSLVTDKPSDGLEPSTPSLPFRCARNYRQSGATVSACLSRFRGQRIRHRSRLFAPALLHKCSTLLPGFLSDLAQRRRCVDEGSRGQTALGQELRPDTRRDLLAGWLSENAAKPAESE